MNTENKLPQGIAYRNLEDLYAKRLHSLDVLFSPNSWINWGFWDFPLKSNVISMEERLRSQQRLYEYSLASLDITHDDEVLEIGCGLGDGVIMVRNTYGTHKTIGLDATPAQIKRATDKHSALLKKDASLSFTYGKAENLPFIDEYFSKIYTIEAAQHFTSMENFIKEAWRCLKPGGKLLITTFFAQNAQALADLSLRMPHNVGITDLVTVISDCRTLLTSQGFHIIECTTIGNKVFPGWEKWMIQCQEATWGIKWSDAWRAGELEYYNIVAYKPE